MGDLKIAAEVFRSLADSEPPDPEARYNEALCLAWLGRNADAVESLDQFVQLAAFVDFEPAANAWCLGEVLRHGAGAEHLADDFSVAGSISWLETVALTDLIDPETVRMVEVPGEHHQGTRQGLQHEAIEWLDRTMPEPSAALELSDLPRVLASVVVGDGALRFSTPDRALFEEFAARLQDRIVPVIGLAGAPPVIEPRVLPLNLLDAAIWTFRLPSKLDESTRRRLTRDAVESFYESTWIHQGRNGLRRDDHVADSTMTPIEAARFAAEGDAISRAKLEGVIRFREQLSRRPALAALYEGYPFDRLRRRLGLELRWPGSVEPDDVSCSSAEELDRLDLSSLEESKALEAIHSAEGLQRRDIAARLASRVLKDNPDALFHHDLLDVVLGQAGNTQADLDWIDFALEVDRKSFAGRHQVVLEQMHSRLVQRGREGLDGEPNTVDGHE